MTAYSPRHAVAVPRAPRRPSRARRLLLALLPARKTAVPDLVPQPPAPFADRFPCCEHCLTGCPCDPQDSHRMPCKDGCNDPRPYDERRCAVPGAHGMTDPYYCTLPAHHCPPPVTLTDAEIAALRPARLTPVEYADAMHAAALPYLPRRERRPGKQPWHTMELPLIPQMRDDGDEEAAELARAGYVRERIPVMGGRPQLEVLARTAAALRTPGVAEAQRQAKAMIA